MFMAGPIWQNVSFPPEGDITDSKIYLFVAVLFFVDKNLLWWREPGNGGLVWMPSDIWGLNDD